jgi:hypothetical protein
MARPEVEVTKEQLKSQVQIEVFTGGEPGLVSEEAVPLHPGTPI